MNPILAFLIFAAGFGAAWSWQGDRADARIAELQAGHERETSQALATLAGRYKESEDRADKIGKAAETRTALLEGKLQETKDAIKTSARGRPCLGGSVLRVLGESPGIRLGTAGPAPADPLHGRSGAAAAHPEDEGEYSTDTEVGEWIAAAGTLYEKCRGQLRDIRAWEEGDRR